MKKNFNKYSTYMLHSKIFFVAGIVKTYPPYIEIDKIPPRGEGIPYIYVWAKYVNVNMRGVPTNTLPTLQPETPTPHALHREL